MRNSVKNIVRFLLFVLGQGLIFGPMDFGYGVHPMIYPLFIMLLPFNMRPISLLFIAFITGLGVDFFMNTFGLNASAAVMVAFFRPFIYNRFAPRDGYDLTKEPTADEWGYKWFVKVAIILISIHHFWYFTLEYFKWSALPEIFINTLYSTIATLLIFILIQALFFSKHKKVT